MDWDERWLLIYQAGENIDRLISLDLQHYGIIRKLYEAAREEAGLPLALKGALSLVKRIKAGDPVLLCTGFPIAPSFKGETDGIVGTAILARALKLGLEAQPIIVTEEENLPLITAACEGAGFTVHEQVDRAIALPDVVTVLPFPKREWEAGRQAAEIASALNPLAILAIEKPGRNAKGAYHASSGLSITEAVAKTEHLFLAVKERGGLTIGIGDQGNELGMGALKDVVVQFNRFGKVCECPCKGGIAAEVPSDVTIVGGVSDWGAIGVAANLTFLTSKSELLPEAEMLSSILGRTVQAGAIDSLSHASIPWIDGIGESYHVRLLEQLHDLLHYTRLFQERIPSRYEHALRCEAFQEWRLALKRLWDLGPSEASPEGS